tara:strand:+ start:80 stop:547 length:468 start_codon:yes stop_codon:yes gene_type:complete
MVLKEGNKAPSFTLPSDSGEKIKLSDFKGKKLIIFFYPKDDTPGCTKESIEFTEYLTKFSKFNTKVVGVSRDSIEKHLKFKDKHSLKVTLASDEDNKICTKYGVWKEKINYGKKYFGIERTTFLINEKSSIIKVWHKVKVKDHVEEVFEYVKGIK